MKSTRSNLALSGVLFASVFAIGCIDQVDPEVGEVEQLTSGSGVTGAILANSLLGEGEIEIKWNGYEAKVEGEVQLVMQELFIQPGGHTGWHTHGGPLFVSLVQGSLTMYNMYNPCVPTNTYVAGSSAGAFMDPGGTNVHAARNEGDDVTIVRVQYILPKGAALRVDAAAPAGAENCPL